MHSCTPNQILDVRFSINHGYQPISASSHPTAFPRLGYLPSCSNLQIVVRESPVIPITVLCPENPALRSSLSTRRLSFTWIHSHPAFPGCAHLLGGK